LYYKKIPVKNDQYIQGTPWIKGLRKIVFKSFEVLNLVSKALFFIMLWFLSVHSLNAVVYIPLVKTQKWVKVHYIHLVVGASNLGTYYIELLHCTSLASLDVRAIRIEEFSYLVLFLGTLTFVYITKVNLVFLVKPNYLCKKNMAMDDQPEQFFRPLTAKKHDNGCKKR
jgi:hypothetical protein